MIIFRYCAYAVFFQFPFPHSPFIFKKNAAQMVIALLDLLRNLETKGGNKNPSFKTPKHTKKHPYHEASFRTISGTNPLQHVFLENETWTKPSNFEETITSKQRNTTKQFSGKRSGLDPPPPRKKTLILERPFFQSYMIS